MNNKMKASQAYDFDFILEFTGKKDQYKEKCNNTTYRNNSTEVNRTLEGSTINKKTPRLWKKIHKSGTHTLNTSFKACNISVDDFLNRTIEYQKKKNSEIAGLVAENNTKIMKELKDKPIIDPYAASIVQKPLYKRVKEEIYKKQVTMDNLKKMYVNMGSVEQDIPEPKAKCNSKYPKAQTQKWIKEQSQHWLKKCKHMSQECLHINQPEACSFKPQILDKSKTITKNASIDNKMSSFDRLYSRRNERNEHLETSYKENIPSFKPMINNKSVYKNVMPKYRDDLTPPKTKNNHHNKPVEKKKQPWGAYRCGSAGLNPSYTPKKTTKQSKEEDVREHWSIALETVNNKIIEENPNNHHLDQSLPYKLNIRQTGAWNDITENQVDLKNAKNILGLILT